MGGELYGGEHLFIWKRFNIFFEKEELKLLVKGSKIYSKESTPRERGFVWSPLEGGQKLALRYRDCWSNGVLE